MSEKSNENQLKFVRLKYPNAYLKSGIYRYKRPKTVGEVMGELGASVFAFIIFYMVFGGYERGVEGVVYGGIMGLIIGGIYSFAQRNKEVVISADEVNGMTSSPNDEQKPDKEKLPTIDTVRDTTGQNTSSNSAKNILVLVVLGLLALCVLGTISGVFGGVNSSSSTNSNTPTFTNAADLSGYEQASNSYFTGSRVVYFCSPQFRNVNECSAGYAVSDGNRIQSIELNGIKVPVSKSFCLTNNGLVLGVCNVTFINPQGQQFEYYIFAPELVNRY